MLTSTNNGKSLAEKDSIQITISAPPVVDILQDTVIVCANNSMVSLSGTVSGPTTTGVWSSTGEGIFNTNNVSLNISYYLGVNDLSTRGTWAFFRSTSNGK